MLGLESKNSGKLTFRHQRKFFTRSKVFFEFRVLIELVKLGWDGWGSITRCDTERPRTTQTKNFRHNKGRIKSINLISFKRIILSRAKNNFNFHKMKDIGFHHNATFVFRKNSFINSDAVEVRYTYKFSRSSDCYLLLQKYMLTVNSWLMEIGLRKWIFLCQELFFTNFDLKNDCKNEFEDNSEKSCNWSRNRGSLEIYFKAVWPHCGLSDSVGAKVTVVSKWIDFIVFKNW